MPYQLINAFWLWMGPSDDPAVNAFGFVALLGAISWGVMPFILACARKR